jgi:hypothetical protein
MEAVSVPKIELSSEERELLVELLHREQTNLPAEIHHTRTGKFREQLRRRMDLVQTLLTRLGAQ